MLHTSRAVIVEGKYDKARLSGIIDALIITTDGFGIFNSKEKQVFIKKTATEKGIIILTDSDSAGFKIRNFLKNIVPEDKIIHAYIPDIYGKEKRKTEPSKEGKLGVEGISNDILENSLLKTGLFDEKPDTSQKREITVADMFSLGLTGQPNSAEKRRQLLVSFGLPARLTGKNLLTVLNTFTAYEDLTARCHELFSD